MNCQRCENNGRPGVPATTRQEYRHASDFPSWPNKSTRRCDRCAQALRDYCALPSISATILVDEPIAGSTAACPECGSEDVSDRQGRVRPDGDDRPPFLLVCESCGHEWEEDA